MSTINGNKIIRFFRHPSGMPLRWEGTVISRDYSDRSYTIEFTNGLTEKLPMEYFKNAA